MGQFPYASVPTSLQLDDQATSFLDDLRRLAGALQILGSGVIWASGTGSPEGVVAAPIGSLYSRLDGSTGTSLYVKESGTSVTGWIAK